MKTRTALLPLVPVLVAFVVFAGASDVRAADWKSEVKKLAGAGSVLVTDANEKPLFALKPDQPFIPASILKVATSGAALAALGSDFRFVTDFHLSKDGDLYVVGRGDPYLISEELTRIAAALKQKGLQRVRNLCLDNSYFEAGLVLDGTERSLNPYDAYNGALCANFNTINVQISAKSGISSAEPQTPLTDLALKLARKSQAKGRVRLNLADDPHTCLMYAGELFQAILKQAGIEVSGMVKPAGVDAAQAPLFYRHHSSKDLPWLVRELLKYSNNFMTNQIFLALGAHRFGPPASPDKSRRAMSEYMTANRIPPFHMEEGSGLSRKTTLNALQMAGVLRAFFPHRELLVPLGTSLIKTGTLRDVKTMAGFITPEKGSPISFVILLNGTQYTFDTRERILALLEANLK